MVRKASLAAGSASSRLPLHGGGVDLPDLHRGLPTSALKWAERHYAIKTRCLSRRIQCSHSFTVIVAVSVPSVSTSRSRRGKPWISPSFSRSGPPTGRVSTPPSGWWRLPYARPHAGGAHGHFAQQPQLADQGPIGQLSTSLRHPAAGAAVHHLPWAPPSEWLQERPRLGALLRGLVLAPCWRSPSTPAPTPPK